MIRIAGVIALLLLAGCDAPDNGASVVVNGADGAATFNSRDGEIAIDTPVFQGSFKLPKMNLTAENFDINGVHLYPGTRIGGVNVAAGTEGKDGHVTVKFDSPADPKTVRDWLQREFARAGTQVRVEGAGLVGTTNDDTFRIDLAPGTGDRSTGTVTIN